MAGRSRSCLWRGEAQPLLKTAGMAEQGKPPERILFLTFSSSMGLQQTGEAWKRSSERYIQRSRAWQEWVSEQTAYWLAECPSMFFEVIGHSLSFFKKNVYVFIFGCSGSLLLCMGFL